MDENIPNYANIYCLLLARCFRLKLKLKLKLGERATFSLPFNWLSSLSIILDLKIIVCRKDYTLSTDLISYCIGDSLDVE